MKFRVVRWAAFAFAVALVGQPISAKPPTQHSPTPARAAAAVPQTGPETLKFTKLSVKDPGINNIEAVSFLIPEGWTASGGVKWFPDYSILANLQMTITDPKSGAQIQFLPVQNFSWVENPVVPMQPGTNYMGNIVHPPVRDVPEFIQLFYAPQPPHEQTLPHLARGRAREVRVEELPKYAEQISRAYGGQSQVKAAKVRYEYERDGKPWEEDVYIALVYTTQQGMTIWAVNTAYSFRAPKGELDKLSPRMATTISTIRLSEDWFAGYMYVQRLFMNRMNQGIRNAAAISETVTRNSEEIRKIFSEAYRSRCESQDRISRGFSEHIRGVESYQNPYEGRAIELPSGYTDAWVNAQGEYIMSSQGGFDPNVGSTVEWRRMGK